MKRQVALLMAATAFLMPGGLRAEAWKRSVEGSLILSEGQYSRNWAGNEVGSVTWTFNLLAILNKQLTPTWLNRNTIKLAFGQTHFQDQRTRDWASPQKSTDLIDLEALFRKAIGLPVEYYAAGRFESGFIDQRDTLRIRAINPVKFTESTGMTRVWMKGEKAEFTSRLGFALHQFYDAWALLDTVDTHGPNTVYDGGIEFVTDYTSPFAEGKMSYTTKLVVFQALFFSESDLLAGQPNENYWREVDIAWESIYNANISKYLTVNFYLQLLYDKEVALGGRYKQTLGLGVTYKLT